MQLQELLRTTRQKALLTQEDFAKQLGVTASTVIRWENGKAKPNISAMRNLKRFCEDNCLQYESIENEWLIAQNKK